MATLTQLETKLNKAKVCVPTSPTAATITTAINEPSKAYSMAVTACSEAISLAMAWCRIFSLNVLILNQRGV